MVHFCHDLHKVLNQFYAATSGQLVDHLAFANLLNGFGKEALDIKKTLATTLLQLSKDLELIPKEPATEKERFSR